MSELKPKLRFGEFNDKWDSQKLGNVSEFLDGERVPLSSEERKNRQGKYPYYGASGIIDYVDDYIFDGEFILLGEDGANIVTRSTRLAFLISGKNWVNNHAHVIQAKGSNYFLSEALERINYVKYNTGTAQPKLNSAVCKSITLNIPSLPEQQKIASFLSSVDKKMQQLTRKKELLEQYKKGVMQKIFSQEIRFKDENGEEFPEWEELALNSFTTPIKRKAKNLVEDVLTISAGKGFLNQKERFNQIIAGSSLEKYTLLQKNEFSYNRGNSKSYTYGCIYKLANYDEALVPNVYRSFSLDKGDPRFFEQLFIGKYLDRQLRRLISSSARMDGLLNIGQEDFYKCKVPFPSIKEQIKIGEFLKNIDESMKRLASLLNQSKQFKRGLLQQMFV